MCRFGRRLQLMLVLPKRSAAAIASASVRRSRVSAGACVRRARRSALEEAAQHARPEPVVAAHRRGERVALGRRHDAARAAADRARAGGSRGRRAGTTPPSRCSSGSDAEAPLARREVGERLRDSPAQSAARVPEARERARRSPGRARELEDEGARLERRASRSSARSAGQPPRRLSGRSARPGASSAKPRKRSARSRRARGARASARRAACPRCATPTQPPAQGAMRAPRARQRRDAPVDRHAPPRRGGSGRARRARSARSRAAARARRAARSRSMPKSSCRRAPARGRASSAREGREQVEDEALGRGPAHRAHITFKHNSSQYE